VAYSKPQYAVGKILPVKRQKDETAYMEGFVALDEWLLGPSEVLVLANNSTMEAVAREKGELGFI
jgi:hypothetical protein